MYSVIGIHGDQEIVIYNDMHLIETSKAISPKLTISDNTAGSLEITLPKGNAGYDILEKMVSELVVFRDDVEIWCGRIISERKDFLNNRILTCEGALAYLNDTIQPDKHYPSSNSEQLLIDILHQHNIKSHKKFHVKYSEIWESSIGQDFYTTEDTTLNNIQKLLIDNYGGHLIVRRKPGVKDEYEIEYYQDYPNINSQTIRFGENLIDFVQNWDMSDIVSVVLPRGAVSGETYVDVSDINATDSPAGDKYVYNNYLMSRYGRIETPLDLHDIDNSQELYEKAVLYLEGIQERIQMDEVTLEVSAIDLRYLGVDYESIKLLDKVRCLSPPHDEFDKLLPVTELSIQLDKPENSKYVLGGRVRQSLTKRQKQLDSDILDRIHSIPIVDEYGILQAAMGQSQTLIDNATNGRITIERYEDPITGIRTESLIVSNGETIDTSDKMWKWNHAGLGFYTRQNIDSEWSINPENGIAIDMTGSISATSIKTGFMSADRIYGGTLQSIALPGQEPNVVWDMSSSGKLTINKGEIHLGWDDYFGGYNFSVDNNGELYAGKGVIGGFNIGDISIYNDSLDLNPYGLTFTRYNNSSERLEDVGRFNPASWQLDETKKGVVMEVLPDGHYTGWFHKRNNIDPAEAKLMYTTVNLTTEAGTKLLKDRIHVGCPISMTHSHFQTTENISSTGFKIYRYLRSATVVFDNIDKPPRRVRFRIQLGNSIWSNSDGWSSSDSWLECYVINGLIMAKTLYNDDDSIYRN